MNKHRIDNRNPNGWAPKDCIWSKNGNNFLIEKVGLAQHAIHAATTKGFAAQCQDVMPLIIQSYADYPNYHARFDQKA